MMESDDHGSVQDAYLGLGTYRGDTKQFTTYKHTSWKFVNLHAEDLTILLSVNHVSMCGTQSHSKSITCHCTLNKPQETI